MKRYRRRSRAGKCLKETRGIGSIKLAKGRYKEKKKLDSGNTAYVYGPRQIQRRHKEKAERLDKLQDKMSNLRKKVRQDLFSNPVALVVAIMDKTAERVGNSSSAKNGHFGVTTWRKKHLQFKDGKAIIRYVGKAGVKQTKEISTKSIVSVLKKISKGLGPEQELFPDVQAKNVNEYLKTFEVSAKDIRGFHANDKMRCLLKKIRSEGPKLPFSRKEKDAILKRELDQALQEIAKEVGHEASTLRNQYLVPGLVDNYLHSGEVMARMKQARVAPVSLGTSKWDQTVWRMDLSKERFIHFSYDSRIDEILRSGKLKMNPPYRKFGIAAISAISTVWGRLVPQVQLTHLQRGDHEPISAVLFKTNVTPKYGVVEEVVWDQDVVFTQAKKISMPEALRMLKKTFKGVGSDDTVVYDKKREDLYMGRTATLSRAEKEDRSSRSRVRPAPKKKPPRYDLRRKNSIREDDPTMENLGRGDGGDRDLSRKSTKMAFVWEVAVRHLESMPKSAKKKDSPDRKPGEVWRTDNQKWRGMNPDGLKQSFDSKQKAKDFANGTDHSSDADIDDDDSSGENEPNYEDEEKIVLRDDDGDDGSEESDDEGDSESESDESDDDGDDEDDEQDIDLAKRLVKEILGDDVVFDDQIQDSLNYAIRGLDKSEKRAFSRTLSDTLKSLSSQDAASKAMINMANKAVDFDGYRNLDDPEELAEKVAEAIFARNVVANPFLLQGKKLSSKELGAEETSRRALASYKHFSSLNSDLREHAARKLHEFLRELSKDDPRHNEANGILSGIALANIVKEGHSVPGRPEPSLGTAQLIKKLADQGNVEILLHPVEDFFEPKNQETLKSAMRKMGTSELFDLIMRDEDEDDDEYDDDDDDWGRSRTRDRHFRGKSYRGSGAHPYEVLRELFEAEIPIPYPYNEGIRDFLINDYLSDHLWKDAVIRDVLKHNEGEDVHNAEKRYRLLQETKREVKSQLFEQWQACLKEAQKAAAEGKSPSKSTEECLREFEENKRQMIEAETAEQFLAVLDRKGFDLPNTAAVAALRLVAQTKDPSVLQRTMEPNPYEFSGQRMAARFFFDSMESIHTGNHFRRQNMTISKQAAQKIVAQCDHLADFFQKHAEELGLSPKVGLDMAKRLDTLSVFIEDRMGVKAASNPTDTVDPTSNFTEDSPESWEFDPSDIGDPESGALLRDEDEPFMDAFNQDEFSQLREVQQKGMFSNAKAASALILKQAKLLAQHGIALPVETKKKSSRGSWRSRRRDY